MNRILAALLLACAAFYAAAPATAQETKPLVAEPAVPPAEEPSLEEMTLGEQLVDLTGQRRLFDEILPNVADQAKMTFIRANPQMQLGVIDVVDKVALEMVQRRGELDRQLARTWGLAFTKDELEDLVAFYSTETGKKFAARHTRILGMQMMHGERWTQAVSEEMTRRVGAELQAAVRNEAQSLESAAPAAGVEAPAHAPAQ